METRHENLSGADIGHKEAIVTSSNDAGIEEKGPYREGDCGGKTVFTSHENTLDQRRRVCGMRLLVFWFGLAIAFIILGGAVGGGVGASIASKNKKTHPTNTNCTSSNNTLITPTGTAIGGTFLVLCDTSIIGVGGRMIDIGSERTSSLQSCVNVCMEYNGVDMGSSEKVFCVAVTWMVDVGEDRERMCWYKSSRGMRVDGNGEGVGEGSVSAVLV